MGEDTLLTDANSIASHGGKARAGDGAVLARALREEAVLMADAHSRAQAYLGGVATRDVYPGYLERAALDAFDEALPETASPAVETLALLDRAGSPATAVSNGPNYFGFVIGATLPAAAAAHRLASAWDQCASSATNSPVADRLERVAGGWLLDILDLPRESGVAFGTSATAGGLTALSVARRELLARKGWDFDRDGLAGAPDVRVVVSDRVHITVLKALRLLGFGMSRIERAPTDALGRIDPARLPALDNMTILCLQAGEVNIGAFDPFAEIIPTARAAGAWVHVDGAFGLWARAAPRRRHLTDGIEGADSWTVDGHKWLNTPYDGGVCICRDKAAMAQAMNADAVYSSAAQDDQKNLGLEFSRGARGIPIWAALRSLGREGVAQMVEGHCDMAAWLAAEAWKAGFEVVTEPVLNQVLLRLPDDGDTAALQSIVEQSGKAWFGTTRWEGRTALRISFSSWRTTWADVERLLDLLLGARARLAGQG
ncbi:MAG: pyridoxal phosphate-dependent decarboxylase family protein [Pseudooceanicola sp.]